MVRCRRQLDSGHNDVGLNFGSNRAISVSVRDHGRGVVGCSFQLVCVSGFDLVAQWGSLTVGNSRMARRGRSALLGSSLDHYAGEACLLQLNTDKRCVVIAVRRGCQKAWRIVRKDFRERVRNLVSKHVLLDAIPNVEQEISSGLEDSLCLTVAQLAVGQEHDTKLATNQIEGGISER